jgi:hypothetical protein
MTTTHQQNTTLSCRPTQAGENSAVARVPWAAPAAVRRRADGADHRGTRYRLAPRLRPLPSSVRRRRRNQPVRRRTRRSARLRPVLPIRPSVPNLSRCRSVRPVVARARVARRSARRRRFVKSRTSVPRSSRPSARRCDVWSQNHAIPRRS